MVVLRNCEESESDKAVEYSEELNGFLSPPSPIYFPPSPTTSPPSPSYFPLYSPPSPPRPSSSNSSVKYVWDATYISLHEYIADLPINFNFAVLVEYKIQDRSGALDAIPTGRLVRINDVIERLDDFGHSVTRNNALRYMHDDWDTVAPILNLRQYCELTEIQNEDIVDLLIVESVDVQQFQIRYRGGAIDVKQVGVVARFNESEVSWGQLSTSTPEPALIFQTNLSLRLWQGYRGQWVAEIRYGWNWLNIGALKTVESAPLSSESIITLRGGKDLFDYPFPGLFINKNREEPSRGSRTGIPPLKSPPTEQQENPNDHLGLGYSEATGNDEFEAVGIGSESTVECEMAEARLNSRCLGKRKTEEKNPGRERRNKGKTNGVRILIPLEDILQTKGMQLKDAAKHLKVSPSTLRRVCRGYNINKWPPQEEYKLIGQSRPKEDGVIVKAKYGSYIIKFQLHRPWEKAKLEEQVKKRLPKLEAGTYLIRYKDDHEDGELILITCDEDLQLYIETSRQKGTTTSIEVLLEQKVADEFCVDQL